MQHAAEIGTLGLWPGESAFGRSPATNEIHQAMHDLSRRPKPDITGAIQHDMVALECVMRNASNEAKKTLGQVIGELNLPKTLDDDPNSCRSANGRAHLWPRGRPRHEIRGAASRAAITAEPEGQAAQRVPKHGDASGGDL